MNNKKVFFTYVRGESGEIKLDKVCMVDLETNQITTEDFDVDKHEEIFRQFLVASNISGETLVSELEEKGLFDGEQVTADKLRAYIDNENGFTINTLDEEKVEEEENKDVENTELEDDEYVESSDNKDRTVAKRVAAGVLAAGVVAGTLVLLHSCEQNQIIDTTKDQTLNDLLNQMSPEQKAFFESTFKSLETFNANAVKEGNFALEQDQTKLHMSVDEAVALNIILNNYSSDDLYNIFGTVKFDTTNVMNLARSAYGKLSTYYMNAKEASGLSGMINDEVARAFFERHENTVIEFNNNPSVELSDKVIKGLYYDYTVNGANGEYAKINNDGVAWLSTSAEFGFELANRNVKEFLKVNSVSKDEKTEYGSSAATVGLTLNKVTSSKLLSGINEEINLDIMDELDNKSLCASVTAQTRDKIDALTLKQSIAATIIETNAKDELVEGLRQNGNISAANKVLASDITPELLKEISQTNSKANELVDDYNARITSLSSKEAKVMAVINLAQEKYNSKEEIDLADLVNNRFRSPLVVEKKPSVSAKPSVTPEKDKLKEELYIGKDKNGTPIYDGDKLNELPEKDKNQFIKDNGEVIKKENITIEKEEVKFEELTKEEQKEVTDQKAILEEIDNMRNKLIEKGAKEANEYTEEAGAYQYSGEIIIPTNSQKINVSNETLAKIAQMSYAYNNKEISSNDPQIQSRMAADSKDDKNSLESLSTDAKAHLAEKYGSDWKEEFFDESYETGYMGSINATLSSAKKQGLILREETEKAYAEIMASNNKQNTNNNTNVEIPGEYVPENNTTNNNNNNNTYDPNLDPNYGMEGEQPYVPKVSIETPGRYISDSELESAFSTVLSEGSSGKGK